MAGRALQSEILNLPNLLTMGRVAIIPVFILLTYFGDPVSSYWSAFIYAGAAMTDVIDGWLARRWNLVTVLGKFLDPLADKLIVMAALVMLVRLGRVASGLVIALLAREFVITGLRSVAAAEGMVIAAGQGGKWKTALQLTGITALLVHYTYDVDFLFFRLEANFNRVGTWLLWLALVASVISAGQYIKDFLDVTVQRQRGASSAPEETAKVQESP